MVQYDTRAVLSRGFWRWGSAASQSWCSGWAGPRTRWVACRTKSCFILAYKAVQKTKLKVLLSEKSSSQGKISSKYCFAYLKPLASVADPDSDPAGTGCVGRIRKKVWSTTKTQKDTYIYIPNRSCLIRKTSVYVKLRSQIIFLWMNKAMTKATSLSLHLVSCQLRPSPKNPSSRAMQAFTRHRN